MLNWLKDNLLLSKEERQKLKTIFNDMKKNHLKPFFIGGLSWVFLVFTSIEMLNTLYLTPHYNLSFWDYIYPSEMILSVFLIGGLLTVLNWYLAAFLILLTSISVTLQSINLATVNSVIYPGQITILLETFPGGLGMAQEKGVTFSLFLSKYIYVLPLWGQLLLMWVLKRHKVKLNATLFIFIAIIMASKTYGSAFFNGAPFNIPLLAIDAYMTKDKDEYCTVPIDLPPPPANEPHKSKILLIIGESEDALRTQFFNKKIQNMPKTSAREDIFIIRDLRSIGGYTTSSLKKIATLNSDFTDGNYPSFWQYAKASGYYVNRISAGPGSWGDIKSLSPDGSTDNYMSLDDKIKLKSINKMDLFKRIDFGSTEDFFWLDELKKITQENQDKDFVFSTLRLLASHGPIEAVTPERYWIFKDDMYSNSLLYTDDLLNDILNERLFKDYWIYFVSDHSSDYKLETPILGFVRPPEGENLSPAFRENLTRKVSQADVAKTIIESFGYREDEYKNDFEAFNLMSQVIPLQRIRVASNPADKKITILD